MILKKINSFTILEITIVVVIVGILAAFAIPRFGKAFQKSEERNAITNLIAMRSAVTAVEESTGLRIYLIDLDFAVGLLEAAVVDVITPKPSAWRPAVPFAAAFLLIAVGLTLGWFAVGAILESLPALNGGFS